MGYLEILALAVALGADCFSVCLGLGMGAGPPRRIAPLSLLFGTAQGALVASGFKAADALHAVIHSEAWRRAAGGWLQGVEPEALHDHLHWLFSLAGAAVLAGLGVNLIAGALRRREGVPVRVYRGRRGLVALVLSANVDAFAAGIGIGMIDGAMLAAVALLMAATGASLSALGMKAGRRLRGNVGRFAQPLGGCVLLLLALRAACAAVAG